MINESTKWFSRIDKLLEKSTTVFFNDKLIPQLCKVSKEDTGFEFAFVIKYSYIVITSFNSSREQTFKYYFGSCTLKFCSFYFMYF